MDQAIKRLKTAALTSAQLDYWTARADGIPADQLTIRRVPRTDNLIVVQDQRQVSIVAAWGDVRVLAYSTDWAQGGPLIGKFRPHHMPSTDGGWWAAAGPSRFVHGSTPLEAICRAIVWSRFGEEVAEIPVEAQP